MAKSSNGDVQDNTHMLKSAMERAVVNKGLVWVFLAKKGRKGKIREKLNLPISCTTLEEAEPTVLGYLSRGFVPI